MYTSAGRLFASICVLPSSVYITASPIPDDSVERGLVSVSKTCSSVGTDLRLPLHYERLRPNYIIDWCFFEEVWNRTIGYAMSKIQVEPSHLHTCCCFSCAGSDHLSYRWSSYYSHQQWIQPCLTTFRGWYGQVWWVLLDCCPAVLPGITCVYHSGLYHVLPSELSTIQSVWWVRASVWMFSRCAVCPV